MWNKIKLGLIITLPALFIISLYLGLEQSPDNTYSIDIISMQDERAEIKQLTAPTLPDISNFTTQAVIEKIPKLTENANITVANMEKHHGFLPTHSLHEYYADLQDRLDSKVIVIHSGVVDVQTLYNTINDPQYFEAQNGGYLLKVPLYVENGATFIAHGMPYNLRLAQESGAFIASHGDVFIVDTTITGWSTENGTPAEFKDRKTFRPFLVFWDSSETYIAGSNFTSLGYSAAKAYGVSFSVHGALVKKNPDLPWPTGWIVESTFDDIYYGLYSYEAEDLAIIGNTYRDNIVYAIDPHDRSTRLIIANNETTGTKLKHGIIVSRDVNNSWIFNNKSHGNAGSGIMVERNSQNNIIAFNTVHNNQDGISYYESSNNFSWGNIIKDNLKSGVRIRNSVNITLRNENITSNGGYGLEAYSANLDHHDERDLETDPYEELASFDIADSKFNDNASGQIRTKNIVSASLSNLKVFKMGAGFLKGDLKQQSLSLYNILTQPEPTVVIQKQESVINKE